MRNYLGLAIGVVLLAAGLTVLGRPRPAEHRSAPATLAPVVELALTLESDRLTPATMSVPKGARVRLRVESRGTRAVSLTLAGYEDRLAIPALSPGANWSGEFIADRPGEDFAWLLGGVPAGRLAVTGSHLVDGHR